MAWPTVGEVRAALTAAGFSAAVVADSDIDRAVADWERTTNWWPFAAGASQTLTWVIPAGGRRIQQLPGILPASVGDVLLAGETPTALGVSLLWLPERAALVGQPYTALSITDTYGNPRLIPAGTLSIEAEFGYCDADEIPDDAAYAVLCRICHQLALPLHAARTSVAADTPDAPVQDVREGEVQRQYATTMTERMAAIEGWQREWRRISGSYRRTIIG